MSNSVITSLQRSIKRQNPLSGTGTVVEHTPQGSRIHVTEVGGASSYKGFLKLTLGNNEDGDNIISITNGSPLCTVDIYEEETAGLAIVNDNLIELPAEDLVISSEVGYIIATLTLGRSEVSFDSYSIAESMPTPETNQLDVLIGTYYTESLQIQVVQQHYGLVYGWIFRNCEDIEL